MTATLAHDLDDAVDYLLDLEDDDFERLVRDNLGDKAPAAVWIALTDPDVVQRTKQTLRGLAGAIHDQLGDYRRDPTTCPSPDPGWYRRTAFLATLINRRAAQVRTAAHEAHLAKTAEGRDEIRVLLRKLAVAVNEHRLACLAAGLDPEPHDLTLWAHLDDLYLPDALANGHKSLADMVTSGRWCPDPTGGESA